MRTDESGGAESGNGFVERDHSCMVSCLLGLRLAAISVPLTFIANGFYGLTNAFQKHFTLEVHEVGIVRLIAAAISIKIDVLILRTLNCAA
ncbi:unnamed protein product [Sphagnum troendelagicum]|uniref:Uncharacterized protein n=1 Tax=Sphagnum troendelagicum TaxID=128251 RepID=A0ABP0THN4_9BRYO